VNVPTQRTEVEVSGEREGWRYRLSRTGTSAATAAAAASQRAVVRITAGPLPTTAVPAFRVELFDIVDRVRGTVVVDLTGTECLDATGIAVLVGAARRLSARGGRLILCQPAEAVVQALVKHGLNRYLPVIAAP
jgi:anti-anti-sigma factor